jgi:hypothetical protein
MRKLRRAYVISGALALGVIGCELIVSNSVPDFHCTANVPGACPTGMFCDPSTLSCVAGTGPNEGGFLDAPGKNDSPSGDDDDDAIGPSGVAIGDPCNNDKPCAKGLLCGAANILTTAIVEADETICTRTCCTSADCPDGFVCFGSGTGGNYCVSAAKAKRSTLGTKKPGAACTDNGECRSGVCTDDKHCLDLCCKVDDCAAGTTCRVKSIAAPPPAKENWVCAPPPTGANAMDTSGCTGPIICNNDNCVGIPQVCRPTCCTNQDCVYPGKSLTFCAFGKFTTTNSYQKWCFTDSGAGAAEGESCTGDGDCAAHFCDVELNRCARICCQDKDCHDDEICKPVAVGQPFLRCVKK